MSVYLAPGVYVEEVRFQPSAIQPASTSVAAIVGPTRSGIVGGRPQLLTSFADYTTYFGDDLPLTFSGTSTLNYTAYSARAFFDNGGQQLYLARITNDTLLQGPKSAQPANAALAIVSGTTTLLNFSARFPGAAGNFNLLFQPNRSAKLLTTATPLATDTTSTLLLKLANVAEASLTSVSASLPTSVVFPLVSVTAAATFSSTAPAAYNFSANELIIYTDQTGTTRTALPAAFAAGILASAVTGPSTAQLPVLASAPAGTGAAPIYSVPVGTNMALAFGVPASLTTLYCTVTGSNALFAKLMNPKLAADTTVPLAVILMGSRNGDGGLFHDSYTISILSGTQSLFSVAGVNIEPDATVNNLATMLPVAPATSLALSTQPVAAAWVGAPGSAAVWEAMIAQFASATNFTLTLQGGSDGASPSYADYAGAVNEQTGGYGLASLEAIDDVSIVLCPAAAFDNSVHQAVIDAIQAHCDRMLYRVGVVDSPLGAAIADVQLFAGQFSDSRLAIYYPWVLVPSTAPSGGNVLMPPSGYVAGLYANTDIQRGVHKAPANVVVVDALGLEVYLNTAQQGILNPLGINCLRFFPSQGYRVWGARTLSADPQWQYVNVRRYFLYLEKSILDSTSWVVFEPNGQALWAAVAGSVSDFLYNEWANGRLFGARPADAFFVRCDQTTMTQADLDNGRLICVIGAAPLYPAEFVIFRIGQWTAGATG